ncbi:MAG: tetratricopeptide repeat protein [Acidobacteriota bacterium]
MRAAYLILAIAFSLSAIEPRSYRQALDLYNHTDYPAAISALRQLPEEARSLELLGRCYLMNADYKKATETLEKAAALEPDNSMIQTWLGRAYGRRAETSFALTALGQANKAREALERAVQLDPKNGEAIDDLFDYYVQAPGLVGGGFDKANKLLPLIGQIDPAQEYYAEAKLAEQKKDFDTAEAQFRRALQVAPNQVSRILELAKFLSRHGRPEEGDKLYERAYRLAPQSPRLLFARAQMWIQSRRNIDQARDLLKQYLASKNLTPDDPSKLDALRLLKKVDGM